MFQKISGNIISGRSRDILWRSLEIYRKKPGTHSSKIGKAMKNSEKIQVSGSRHCNFPASKKSKFLALPLPAWMVDTQGFIRFIFAGSWWASPKWNSSFRAWHWALPRSQLFFFWGEEDSGFSCVIFPLFPMVLSKIVWIFVHDSEVFRVVLPKGAVQGGAVQGGAVKIWEHDFLNVLRFFFVYPTRQRNSNMPIISLCIAFVMCTAKPSIWEYLRKSSGKYENLRKFSKKNPEHRRKSMNILRKIIIFIIFIFIYYPYTL